MTTRPPLRVALVGAGRWGCNYLRTLSTLRDCELVGIAEPDRGRARTAGDLWSAPVLPSLERLLDEVHPEAVVIATPDQLHFPLARTALEADCDVLVEKPLASDYAAAAALRNLARARKLVLAVGQTTACHPGFRRLQASIAGGAVGRPVRAQSTRTSHGAASGDPLWDLAPHSIALAFGLFGLPGGVSARFEDDGVSFDLEYPDALRFAARVAWTRQPAERMLVVEGNEGSIEFDETRPPRAGDSLPLTVLCEEFITACRTRIRPCADAELGVAVVACIEALAASARVKGRRLEPSFGSALQ